MYFKIAFRSNCTVNYGEYESLTFIITDMLYFSTPACRFMVHNTQVGGTSKFN